MGSREWSRVLPQTHEAGLRRRGFANGMPHQLKSAGQERLLEAHSFIAISPKKRDSPVKCSSQFHAE
jgi:hypothetical protein